MTTQPRVVREPRNRIRETGVDRAFTIINYTLLTLFLLVILYPLVYVVSASFSDGAAVIAGKVWLLPVNPSLLAYKKVFSYPLIWSGYGNSLFYAVVGTLVNVTMTLIAAYPLSRRDLYGRNVLMGLFLFTLFFSGGLIPSYLLVRDLGMRNTRWALIIPQALSVWNLLIAITFLRSSIPHELLDARQRRGQVHVDESSERRLPPR